MWCRLHSGALELAIWDDIRMLVDPGDTIGGNLAFIPQLYDRWERAAIASLLPSGGVFVDVGSNIGAYALWGARHAGPTGTVVAIEADPENFARLKHNVALNGFTNVRAVNLGVSDAEETLRLHRNRSGNSGGHTFARHDPDGLPLECRPLARILADVGAGPVDVLKLDIEGFELRVLKRYFTDLQAVAAPVPRFVLLEWLGGPTRSALAELHAVLTASGYSVVRAGENALFRHAAA
jgi:FkbM family methyltransferase